nr:hydroxyisourate hydrolase [Hymenobacter sp. IS2118]
MAFLTDQLPYGNFPERAAAYVLNIAAIVAAVAEKTTDAAGRVGDFPPMAGQKTPQTGIFKLTFPTQAYFAARQQTSFYPYIDVVFELKDGERTTTCPSRSRLSATPRTGAAEPR